LEDQVARHRSALVKRELPATCLLYLAIKKSEGTEREPEPLSATELAPEDEAAIEKQRFRSRLRIHLTGEGAGQTSNLVRVEGSKVVLYDSNLALVLRLVIGLYESDDGYVPLGSMKGGGGLAKEGLAFEEDLHNLIHRVRMSFRSALGELSEKQFIEVNRKRIRLSTHKRFVTWDEERLLNHPNTRVQGLFRRLLDQATSPATDPELA